MVSESVVQSLQWQGQNAAVMAVLLSKYRANSSIIYM